MAEVMVSIATGVMTSVIDKLTSLLGENFKLASNVRGGIRFMRDELSSMNAALLRLAEMDDDQIDVQTKEWRSKVRELSYDIEDCVDRFMLLHSSRKAKVNFVQSMVRKIKDLWEDHRIAKEIQELKDLVVEQKNRRDRYNLDQYLTVTRPVLLDPRAPTMYEEAKDLVGIDGPREEIIGLLKSEERQLKVVAIFGIGGQGKTTLAMEVYRKIKGEFDCHALVTVSRTPDIKKLLTDIFSQVNDREFHESQGLETEQLTRRLRKYLMDKRYMIIIDDIWTKAAWEHVKSALPDNNNQSRIITTTRIRDVAKSSCTSIEGHMYEAKTLNEDESCTLFFRRIFGSREDCPQELKKVANDILRKSGGLPLAIISIAGLLANRRPTVEAWGTILNSICSAMEKDSPIDKMKRIIFLSYFDLPHHLKTCLLYLSVFPEDYTIDARDLIWRWVAEGLIPGHNRENMEQLAENYLNELVNRSMIQPVRTGANGHTVKLCRVHDVILDFIVSQAIEDNFVTIWNGNDFSRKFSNKMRRISMQMDNTGAEVMEKVMKNVSYLRSVDMFNQNIELDKYFSELLNSHVLRVMNVEGGSCTFQDFHVGQSFSQLKYIKIGSGGIQNLPEEIGKLQHLETLNVEGSNIKELPESIALLQKLVHLFVSTQVQLPNGIGNLRSLETLSYFNPCRSSAKSILGVGDLINLRELSIYWDNLNVEVVYDDIDGHMKVCYSSLSKLLMRLRTLNVHSNGSDFIQAMMASGSDFTVALMASSGSSSTLQKLILTYSYFDIVPSEIKSLVNLTCLKFSVWSEISKEGLNILASLPMLLSLTVELWYVGQDVFHPRHTIGSQGFRRLVKFHLYCIHAAALEFEPEAMPKLQRLKLRLKARCQFKYGQGGLVLGLQNLSGLKHMIVKVACHAAVVEEAEALENDIRGAAGAHPNRPILEIKREDTNHMRN